ncbi:MAG: hypothetical protein M3P84_04260 [Chloroflexota bacterium]|nr:hypothetical protein [Chloroflexota bacterium]
MTASSRSVQQQALGTGQLWAALAVVTLAVVIALAIAFGSRIETKPAAPGIGVQPQALPMVGYDHGSSNAALQTSPSLPMVGYDHGSSGVIPSAIGIDQIDHGARDDLGAVGPGRSGYVGDPGLAPRTNDVTVKSAPNKGPLHRRAQ